MQVHVQYATLILPVRVSYQSVCAEGVHDIADNARNWLNGLYSRGLHGDRNYPSPIRPRRFYIRAHPSPSSFTSIATQPRTTSIPPRLHIPSKYVSIPVLPSLVLQLIGCGLGSNEIYIINPFTADPVEAVHFAILF